MRASRARNAAVVDKIAAVFETYWVGGDFVPHDRARFLHHVDDARRARRDSLLSPNELRPEPFRARMLEQLALARLQGRRNPRPAPQCRRSAPISGRIPDRRMNASTTSMRSAEWISASI